VGDTDTVEVDSDGDGDDTLDVIGQRCPIRNGRRCPITSR
jgi:hypothetical protein